jgi:hypothetical protein
MAVKSAYQTTEPLDTLLPALRVIRVLEGLRLQREVREQIFTSNGLPGVLRGFMTFAVPINPSGGAS